MLVHCCWMVLADPDLIQATVVTLSSSNYSSFTFPQSAVAPQCPETCQTDYAQWSFQYHPEGVFLEKNLWTFCGSLVFGPESCFSQGNFILLDYFICPTPGPYSLPLWSTLYQKDSSTLNFEKQEQWRLELPFFFFLSQEVEASSHKFIYLSLVISSTEVAFAKPLSKQTNKQSSYNFLEDKGYK